MVNIFNPELVIIGGGVSLAGDILFEKLMKIIKNSVLVPSAWQSVKIVPAKLGYKEGLIGAIELARSV